MITWKLAFCFSLNISLETEKIICEKENPNFCLYFFVLLEPPDLKNCFSNYVYESPVLSTSDEVEDSLCLDRGPEIDELVAEDSDVENEEKLVTIRKVKNRGGERLVKKAHSNGLVKHNPSYEVVEQENECISKVFFLYLSPVTFFVCLWKIRQFLIWMHSIKSDILVSRYESDGYN